MRRIAVLIVVVILFHHHASDEYFKKPFLEAGPGDFSCIAYLSSMLFLIKFGEVVFQLGNQNKLGICIHFDQICTWHRCLKLSFFGLYIYVRSLKTCLLYTSDAADE